MERRPESQRRSLAHAGQADLEAVVVLQREAGEKLQIDLLQPEQGRAFKPSDFDPSCQKGRAPGDLPADLSGDVSGDLSADLSAEASAKAEARRAKAEACSAKTEASAKAGVIEMNRENIGLLKEAFAGGLKQKQVELVQASCLPVSGRDDRNGT